jgi:hypothetical protein
LHGFQKRKRKWKAKRRRTLEKKLLSLERIFPLQISLQHSYQWSAAESRGKLFQKVIITIYAVRPNPDR